VLLQQTFLIRLVEASSRIAKRGIRVGMVPSTQEGRKEGREGFKELILLTTQHTHDLTLHPWGLKSGTNKWP